MKKDKIAKAFHVILPEDDSKKRILTNVMTEKKGFKLRSSFILIGSVVCCMVLVILNYNMDNNPGLMNRQIDNQIIYHGVCYVENGSYTGHLDSLKFIEESQEFIFGNKIYQNGNFLVFQKGEMYVEFRKCEGE